jgi:ABC-2 type transport system permease protein
MKLWPVVWELTLKDLRLYVRDRTALALGFLLPLGLVTIFGFVMGNVGGSDKMPAIDVAVSDEDGTQTSRALVAALQSSEMLDAHLPPAGKDGAAGSWSRDDVLGFVRDGSQPVAIRIPHGYGAGTAELELLVDPGRTMEKRMVDIALMQAIFQAGGQDAAWSMSRHALVKAGLPSAWADRIGAATGSFRASIEGMFHEADAAGLLGKDDDNSASAAKSDAAKTGSTKSGGSANADSDKPLANGTKSDKDVDISAFMQDLLPVTRTDVAPEGRAKQISYQVSHAVSGMTVMMLMFSLVGFARSLLEERAHGTLRRLLSAPIDPRALLLSKLLTSLIVGMALIVVLFTFAALAFHLDILSRWDTLLVVSIATALACTAFALAIAAWARSDKQADGVATLLILIMAPLGGCWIPLMLLPPVVRTIAHGTLPYWSLTAFQGTFWYGQHWTDAPMLQCIGVLLAIAVVLFWVANRLFRARYLAG